MRQRGYFVRGSVLFLSCCMLCISAWSQRCFKSIEEAKASGQCVECLDLSRKRLKKVPEEVLEFKDLKRLILSRNHLSGDMSELSCLTNLRYLDLSSNYIEELSPRLAVLRPDSLVMWDNPIRVLPEELLQWDLRYLDLRAIQMNRKEQRAIKALFPKARIRLDHPCNCR